MKKYIELKDEESRKTALFLDYIAGLYEIEYGKTRVVMADGKGLNVNMSYQEVKDMIAACYGGEDEED